MTPIHTEHPELFLKFALEERDAGFLPVRSQWIEV